nr:zinc knuckle CX2CX4HX4C [Tanacetum cinerariifolium]
MEENAGKDDESLSGMTNDDRIETMDALDTIYISIQADNTNADVIHCKLFHVDDSINLNVDESTMPSDLILQSMDINAKSTSYDGAVGASAKDQPKVNSNFRHLVADPVFDGVNISIPRKDVKKVSTWSSFALCLNEVNSEDDLMDVVTIGITSLTGNDFAKETIHVEYEWRPPRCDICKIFGHVRDHCPKKVVNHPIVATSNVFTPTVEKTNDGFQTMGKKKKKKDKSKPTNGEEYHVVFDMVSDLNALPTLVVPFFAKQVATEPNSIVLNENSNEFVQEDAVDFDGNVFYTAPPTIVFKDVESSSTYQDPSNMNELNALMFGNLSNVLLAETLS